ncbi:hypothetical protein K488DRAFT_84670 [Vararia minispora EC-137]|uniref:Uncharacterized protein n=1 Tax=Vararia minispora EC-137 TaxID=1314806 RepID=A0ACB8QPL3_9AGAM|nr:hypothetical protein K488DRAFT_84670 [Vararia minispora EC-137]
MATLLEASYKTAVLDITAEEDPRVVRFDNECVLIPRQEHSRMPRLLQKSYSLPPLFRRRESQSPNPIDEAANQDVIPNASRASFVSMWSRKTTLTRRASSSERERIPLHSCLVHHDPLAPARSPRIHRPSFPLPVPHSPTTPPLSSTDVNTVPLRPCCPNCFHVTDACLSAGDAWRERFTRAARSRRRASVDYQVARAEKSDSGAGPGAFAAVTVDEVAKVKADVKLEPREPSPDPTKSSDSQEFLSVPNDMALGAMLSRRTLSPIPSRSVSVEDLGALDPPSSESEAELHFPSLDAEERTPAASASPPASPPPRTPSPLSFSQQSRSPKARFRLSAGAEILRVGVDVLKGISSFGSPTL